MTSSILYAADCSSNPALLQSGQGALQGHAPLPDGTYQLADALNLTPQLDQLLAPLTHSAILAGLRITVPTGETLRLVSGMGPVPVRPAAATAAPQSALWLAAALVGAGLVLHTSLNWAGQHPLAALMAAAVVLGSYQALGAGAPVAAGAPMPDRRLHLLLTAEPGITVQHASLWGSLCSATVRGVTQRADQSVVLEGEARLLGVPLSLPWLCDQASALNLWPLSRPSRQDPVLTVSPSNTVMAQGNTWRAELLPGSQLTLEPITLPGAKAVQLKGAVKLRLDVAAQAAPGPLLLELKPVITVGQALGRVPQVGVILNGLVQGADAQALLLDLGVLGSAPLLQGRLQADRARVRYTQEGGLDDFLALWAHSAGSGG